MLASDSHTEASTMALVESEYTEEFAVAYGARDAILYALSIGFGSDSNTYQNDLRYLYDEHEEFNVFPTQCLSFIFWARANGTSAGGLPSRIPTFPPPLMQAMEVLPKRFLRKIVPIDGLPIIHTSQAVVWNRDLPIPLLEKPVRVVMRGKTTSVVPKSIGTFVTTETSVHENSVHSPRMCTVQSTVLVLGFPSDCVIPFLDQSPASIPNITSLLNNSNISKTLLFEAEHKIPSDATILYRLASGDSNSMHIIKDSAPLLTMSDRQRQSSATRTPSLPLLHGLCTLGIATRMIQQYVSQNQKMDVAIRHLQGKFTNPVFVGDWITVRAWKVAQPDEHYLFEVQNSCSKQILLDNGYIRFGSETNAHHSRL